MGDKRRTHKQGAELRRLRRELETQARLVDMLISQNNFEFTSWEIIEGLMKLNNLSQELAKKAAKF